MPALHAFTLKYPEVELEIIASSNELDLAAREADVALGATNSPPENLLGKRIAQLGYAIYGTEKHLNDIMTSSDKVAPPCITWLGDGKFRPAWIHKSFPQTQRIYRTTELGLMLRMTREVMGIAQMPCVFCDSDPLLKSIPAQSVEPGCGL